MRATSDATRESAFGSQRIEYGPAELRTRIVDMGSQENVAYFSGLTSANEPFGLIQ